MIILNNGVQNNPGEKKGKILKILNKTPFAITA
jgi:hypothetical protein